MIREIAEEQTFFYRIRENSDFFLLLRYFLKIFQHNVNLVNLLILSFGGVILPDVSDSNQTIAYEVEQCQCGPEYTGLSCEVGSKELKILLRNGESSLSVT